MDYTRFYFGYVHPYMLYKGELEICGPIVDEDYKYNMNDVIWFNPCSKIFYHKFIILESFADIYASKYIKIYII